MSSFISKFLNFIFPPVTHSCSCLQEIDEIERRHKKQLPQEDEDDLDDDEVASK